MPVERDFFFLRKILKNNFENGLVRLIVYRDYNVIELSMKKNNKKKKLRDQSSISRFTLLCHTSMKILFILRLNEHTVPEKGLHYA